MKTMLLAFAAAGCLVATTAVAQQTDPQPTCKMCPGTYIPLDELQAYTKKAIAEKRIDQQVRDIDIGKAHIGIGMPKYHPARRIRLTMRFDALDAAA